MKLGISEATTLPGSFADDVQNFVAGGCLGMEVWLTKLEKHLEQESVAATQQLIADKGLSLLAAAYQGGLLLSQGEARTVNFDHFKRRLDLCQTFAIPTMLLVADFTQTRFDANLLPHCIASLAEVGEWAAAFGVRLALEFRGADTFCTCVDTAVKLVAECGSPHVGICLDWFHFYRGPSKVEDLAYLTRENLFHVQVSDVAGVPRELMSDRDRVFPGEGDFRFDALLAHLDAIGYDSALSLELMNPTLWQLKATQVIELAWSSLLRLTEKKSR